MVQLDISKVSLRPETDEDRDFLLGLYVTTREGELKNIGWSQAEIERFLHQQFEAQYLSYRNLYPDAEYQIIEIQQQAVGRLYLHRGTDEYRLIDIALVPECRNQKLGFFLIQTILDSAAQCCIPVSLHAEHSNPARRLYLRMGFVDVENRGLHMFMRWSRESAD